MSSGVGPRIYPWPSGLRRSKATQPEGGLCPGLQPQSMVCSGTGHRNRQHMGPLDTAHFILPLKGTAFLPIVDLWHRPLFDKVCPTWGGRDGWEYNSVWNEHYTLGAGPTPASIHRATLILYLLFGVPAFWLQRERIILEFT